MTHYCENQYCENEASHHVHVSVDRPGDQKRRLCAACEEVFTWGVQHGRIVAEDMAQRQLRDKDRIIRAQARTLRRIRKEAKFSEDDGAMDLGERLLEIERRAAAAPVQKERVGR